MGSIACLNYYNEDVSVTRADKKSETLSLCCTSWTLPVRSRAHPHKQWQYNVFPALLQLGGARYPGGERGSVGVLCFCCRLVSRKRG